MGIANLSTAMHLPFILVAYSHLLSDVYVILYENCYICSKQPPAIVLYFMRAVIYGKYVYALYNVLSVLRINQLHTRARACTYIHTPTNTHTHTLSVEMYGLFNCI